MYFHTTISFAYFLWTLLVDDLSVMLRLVAILPDQIDNQLATTLFLASIDRLDLVLPRAGWRTPLLRSRWRCCVGRMRCAASRPLRC